MRNEGSGGLSSRVVIVGSIRVVDMDSYSY